MNYTVPILIFSIFFQIPLYAMELEEFVPSDNEKTEQHACLNRKQRFAQWCIRNKGKLGTASALIGLGGLMWTIIGVTKAEGCLYNLHSCTVSCNTEYGSEINRLEESNNTFPYSCLEFCPSISTKNTTQTDNDSINRYCTIISPESYGTLNCTYVQENDPKDCSRKNKIFFVKLFSGIGVSMPTFMFGITGALIRCKKN